MTPFSFKTAPGLWVARLFVAVIIVGLSLMVPQTARAAETRLTGAEISVLLPQIIVTSDSTRQTFQADGATQYEDAGKASYGWWEVRANLYCSAWGSRDPASWGCYQVWRDDDVIIWVSEAGHRIANIIEQRENHD